MAGSDLVKTTPRRVKRMQKDLDEAHKTYDDIINLAGPRLKVHEEGRAILKHTDIETFGVWRAKGEVKRLREGLKVAGWFEKNVLPLLRLRPDVNVQELELTVKSFVLDSVNTSTKADQFLAALPADRGSPILDPTDETNIIPTTARYLMTRHPRQEIANNRYGGIAPDPRPHSQLL